MQGKRRTIWAVIAACGLLGALFACFIAWLTRVLLCEGPDCRPPPVLETQLIVALVGLLPVAVLIYAVARGRTRLAVGALASGLTIYAAWALLNNLAVHGSLFGG